MIGSGGGGGACLLFKGVANKRRLLPPFNSGSGEALSASFRLTTEHPDAYAEAHDELWRNNGFVV
jgi:hypothetical protein